MGQWEVAKGVRVACPRTLSFFPLPSLLTTQRGLQLRRREGWRLTGYNVGAEGNRGIARIFQREKGAVTLCHTQDTYQIGLLTSMLCFKKSGAWAASVCVCLGGGGGRNKPTRKKGSTADVRSCKWSMYLSSTGKDLLHVPATDSRVFTNWIKGT